MEELYRQLPAIIEQAAKSPLGLLALMVIALAGLGLVFFRSATERTRIMIFVLLLGGVAVFAIAAMRVAGPADSDAIAPAQPDAAIAPAADVAGEWTATVTYDFERNGEPAAFDERFIFKQHAGTLIGTASWAAVPRTVEDATVSGNTMTFVTRGQMTINHGDAEETRDVTRRYIGEIENVDTIRFVMLTEGDFSEHAPVEFVATRTNP